MKLKESAKARWKSLKQKITNRSAAQICHGRGEIQGLRIVRRDAHLDRAGPLVDKAVDADLKELVGHEGPLSHNDAVVELVKRSAPLPRPLAGRQFHHGAAAMMEPESIHHTA